MIWVSIFYRTVVLGVCVSIYDEKRRVRGASSLNQNTKIQ